jgi:hypothetical protein
MERSLSQFVPTEKVQKLVFLPGTRNRLLPLSLVFWSFLQVVMDPNSSTREAQRSIQAWWRQKGRSWSEPPSRAFCEARLRLPMEWLVRVWGSMLIDPARNHPSCRGVTRVSCSPLMEPLCWLQTPWPTNRSGRTPARRSRAPVFPSSP